MLFKKKGKPEQEAHDKDLGNFLKKYSKIFDIDVVGERNILEYKH